MRKAFKILGYLLIFLISAVAAFALYMNFSNASFRGDSEKATVTYLRENVADVSQEIDGSLFDSTFFSSDIFLLGEIHGFAENQSLDRKMLTYLHKNLGVRNYISEIDSNAAGLLNRFLRKPTKDLSLLQDVVGHLKQVIPQQAGQEYVEKWSALYDYNQPLADSLKITVWGIDRALADTSRSISRDSVMRNNLLAITTDPAYKNEKFYGLFGFFHVLQTAPKGHTRPLAQRLLNSGLQVTSIVSYMLESNMYLPKGLGMPTPDNESVDLMNADGPIMVVDGISDLQEASDNFSTLLFKLNAPNSPYRSSLKLSRVKFNFFGEDMIPDTTIESTVQSFQYVFLSKGSPAVRPLR
ncbi:hypothetical protein [Sphingobacterium bambusae]|uniref:Erythromycin esterase n=1 Tax=Sphingobacterium bambusae TaxID=662858 RepID=A0ABW6BJU4_9SPHI|nr:hypothetical protein [Sphingobacterium bambusae]WPL49878.1 hypothetical protein SCB77_05345 [Sphingobacterium bambusae]